MIMQIRFARGCAVAFAISLALLLPPAAPAAADTNARADAKARFDIPAEDLGKALRDFAIQANYNLSYDPTSVQHLKAPAVKGEFTVPDALSLILRGTHLRAVNINENTIQVLDGASTTTDLNTARPAAVVRLAYATPDAQAPTSAPANQNIPAPSSSSSSADDNKTLGLEEIIVTGTNISGVENKTVPLLTFDRDAIDRSGYATMQDFITALPQNAKSGANSPDGVLSGVGFGFGNIENSTAANLRGLGANSTLTLINGHRVAPSSYGSGVDLSMIPLSAVERIDILTDGSSAVYGSDAVGGVVNIILRKDFNGEETNLRLDTLSRGGGEQKQVGQTVGRTWATGGALAVFQFEDANNIRSDERTFTENLPAPTDVYPASKRYSGVISAHQDIGGSVEVFVDAQLGRDDGLRNSTLGGSFPQIEILSNKTNSVSANTGLTWQPFGDWHLEGNVLFSQVDTLAIEQFLPLLDGYTNGTPYLRNLETIKEGDVKLDGTLWSSGGSSVKAAVGASYRQEAFSAFTVYADFDQATSRHVHAAFAELYSPLITSASDVPFVKRLDLSAALRDDSYSDFGSKINPRFGVFFSPIDQIALRAAYSTSFRAPNASEFFDTVSANLVFVESGFPQPGDPNGNANIILFGNQKIGPETSRNLTAGLDFKPTALANTVISLNYYRIIYSNRIIVLTPNIFNVFVNPQIYGPLIRQFPNDAAVEAFVAGLEPAQQVIDLSNSQTGLGGVRFGFPYGAINAAKVKTEGLDFGAHSVLTLQGRNKLNLDFNATYIREIQTTFCDSCVSDDLVNTYAQPLNLRLRGGAGWSNGIFGANGAVNFANAYSDTNLIPPGRIASFTTVDLNANWHIRASGTTLTLNVINALNSNPPRTAPALNNVAYDPNNADARGRILSLQVKQSW
jgi:iron complex outermembrane recepter protein